LREFLGLSEANQGAGDPPELIRPWSPGGASVRRHRRAQGGSPMLRSIRPTRASRPYDASVDQTEARNDILGCFGRSDRRRISEW